MKAVDLDVKKWSAEFSNSICEEYEIPIRLPGLLNLLKCSGDILLSEEIPTNDSSIVIHDKVVNFISAQLQKIGQMEDLPHQQNQKTFRVNIGIYSWRYFPCEWLYDHCFLIVYREYSLRCWK